MDLTLRLNQKEAARLRKRAEVEGLTEQALALTAIRHFLDTGTQPDAQAQPDAETGPVDEVKRRYASALKRIGE